MNDKERIVQGELCGDNVLSSAQHANHRLLIILLFLLLSSFDKRFHAPEKTAE